MQTALGQQDLSPVHLTSPVPHFLGESGRGWRGGCVSMKLLGSSGHSGEISDPEGLGLSDMSNLLIGNVALFLLFLIATQTSQPSQSVGRPFDGPGTFVNAFVLKWGGNAYYLRELC